MFMVFFMFFFLRDRILWRMKSFRCLSAMVFFFHMILIWGMLRYEVFAEMCILYSHYHWDHSGDPSTFPPSTALVVGPGFKDAFVPAYPTKPGCAIHESDYAGRELREIEFDGDLTIGGFKAFDYFGDGSFYLLDSPGVSCYSCCC